MKLVIDVGNTKVKAGVFSQKQLIEVFYSDTMNIRFIENMCNKYVAISSVIFSSVIDISDEILQFLKRKFYCIELFETTPIPIINLYKTPSTLGKDRLAGVVGAYFLSPSQNTLVIDAGTCITYDFINCDGKYMGGSISPGLFMRFRALHTFTGKLPLVSIGNKYDLIGVDTETSIRSGVVNGVVAEIEGIISKYEKNNFHLKTFLCGGDASFLADKIKNSIFAVPELVLTGLNEILDYNDKK